jgi:O-antigen ligase
MPVASVLVTLLLLVLPLAHVTGLRNFLGLLTALWAVGYLYRARVLPPLVVPLAVWLLLAGASSVWSPSAEDALKAVVYEIILPAGAFYCAYLVSRQPASYRSLYAAVIAGAAALAVFIAIPRVVDGLAKGSGLFYYYPEEGVTTTLCIYGLPFGLLLAREADRFVRSFGYFGIACIATAGMAGENRMFWLSAVAVLAAFWAWQWRLFSFKQRMAIAAALILGAALAVSIALHLRVYGSTPLALVAHDNRPAAWREWGKIASDAAILGYGFGLKSIYSVGKEKLPAAFAQRNPEMQIHSHNILLNIVLQVGLVGLAVFVWLLASLVQEAWRAREGPEQCALGAALVALVVALLTKNATDDFNHHAGVIAFWAYAGVLMGRLYGLRDRTSGS